MSGARRGAVTSEHPSLSVSATLALDLYSAAPKRYNNHVTTRLVSHSHTSRFVRKSEIVKLQRIAAVYFIKCWIKILAATFHDWLHSPATAFFPNMKSVKITDVSMESWNLICSSCNVGQFSENVKLTCIQLDPDINKNWLFFLCWKLFGNVSARFSLFCNEKYVLSRSYRK